MIILGLMTGTSMDGLDACLVNLNVDEENRLFIGSVKVDKPMGVLSEGIDTTIYKPIKDAGKSDDQFKKEIWAK